MRPRSLHVIAAAAFAGSLAAYLVASGLSLILDMPRVVEVVRHAATAVALASLLVLFARPNVWAIARNTIAQAVRVKVAFVIMALYLVLVPALPFLVKGDGTLRGLLHVVIAYSLIAAGLLLGILTLTLSTTTLWTEIREKQIFLLEAKPVRRWEVLLGKLLGIILINAALLAFMGVVTWGSVRYLVARAERATRALPASDSREKERAERHLRDAQEQVLTARRTVRPDPPSRDEVQQFVMKNLPDRVRYLIGTDKMPPEARVAPDEATRQRIIENAAARELVEIYFSMITSAPPLRGPRWGFSGLAIPRVHELNLTLRFKFASSDRKSEEPDHIRWIIGAPRRDIPPEQRHQVYSIYDTYLPDEVHELQVPADAVDREGRLEVQFYNIEPRRPTLVFSEADSIQLLVPVGGFAGNLARGLAVIFAKVLFIAALGLCCSTFLGFPVSPIVALAVLLEVFLVGMMAGQFDKGFTFESSTASPTTRFVDRAARVWTAALHAVLPPLEKHSPSERVSAGEEVSLGVLLDAVWSISLVFGGLLMLFGAHVFHRRELAQATP